MDPNDLPFSPLDTPGFQVGLPANFTPDQMAMLTENAMDSMMSEMATRLKGVTGLQGPHLPWYGRYTHCNCCVADFSQIDALALFLVLTATFKILGLKSYKEQLGVIYVSFDVICS